jgi:hypothetical protein
MQGMARANDMAGYYGLDQKQGPGNDQNRGQIQEYSRER